MIYRIIIESEFPMKKLNMSPNGFNQILNSHEKELNSSDDIYSIGEQGEELTIVVMGEDFLIENYHTYFYDIGNMSDEDKRIISGIEDGSLKMTRETEELYRSYSKQDNIFQQIFRVSVTDLVPSVKTIHDKLSEFAVIDNIIIDYTLIKFTITLKQDWSISFENILMESMNIVVAGDEVIEIREY